MSDYRNYIRAAAGFDGITPDVGPYTGVRFVRTTTNAGAVGRFSPQILGRDNIVSFVRVMLQGVVAPGDFVRVIDSSGGTRFDMPASLDSSGWFWMGPRDTLAISAAGATSADICVNDLQDDQLGSTILAEIQAGLGSTAPAPLTTAANPLAIAAFSRGTFYVTGSAGAPAIVNLASVADFGVGARIVLFNDTAFNYTVTPVLGELINGAATLTIAAGLTTSIEAAATQWIAIV